MGEVVSIRNGEPLPEPMEASEQVVKNLEDLLERAKAGMIVSFAFAAIEHDGLPLTCFVADNDPIKLLGAVIKLEDRLLDA